MPDIWIWPRGDFFLSHFLPLNFSIDVDLNDFSSDPSTAEVAHSFLDHCHRGALSNNITRCQFMEIVKEMDLDLNLTTVVFNNSSHGNNVAPVTSLSIGLFLLGLEFYTCREQEKTLDDVICEFVREKIADVCSILLRCTPPFKGLSFSDFSKIPLNNRKLDNLNFLDDLFEGTVDGNEGESDDIIKVSEIAKVSWKTKTRTLSEVVDDIRTALISNPFGINDLSVLKPPTNVKVQKKTSLGVAHRRRVSLSSWKRMEILRKGVYRSVHLRIISAQKNPSPVLAPWKSLSVIVDNVASCGSIVLGPCSGTVIIRDCHNSSISVIAKSIFVWNCSKLKLFSQSIDPVVLRDSYEIQLAPFNVAYTGLEEELAEAKFPTNNNVQTVVDPVVIDDSTYVFMKPSSFYIQPVPIERSATSYERLIESLPERYRNAWLFFLRSMDTSRIEPVKLSKRDKSYLQSKITE